MRGRYQALVNERAQVVAQATAIADAAETEARGFTDEERTQMAAFKARVAGLNQDIADEESVRDMQLAAAGPTVPGTTSRIALRERAEDDPKRGFANIADFALSVRAASQPAGRYDERLRLVAAPANFIQESGSANGDGYAVPPEFSTTIMDLVDAAEQDQDLLSLVKPKNTSSNAVQLLVDETAVWSGNGIQANWRAEGTQMSPTRLLTKGRSIRLWELDVFVLATEEMLADVVGLNERLTEESAEAVRWKAGEAIMRGSGVGQPTGLLNAGSLVTQAAESGQAASTINATNIAKMYSRMLGGVAGSFWLANYDVFPQLMTMSIANQPIWLPPTGYFSGPGGNLLGRPVYLTEHSESLGTVGDILLVNPDGYGAYRRTADPQFASSMHLYFDYAIQAFRWTFRFGGEPLLSAAITANKGSASKSHVVALAAR